MASRNQILKALDSALKAVDKATRNISLYTERRDKALLKACKKGFNLSVDSFIVEENFSPCDSSGDGYVHKTIKCIQEVPFTVVWPIVSAWEYLFENERKLKTEQKRLEVLKTELNSLDGNNKRTTDITLIIEDAMADFKKEWFAKMELWYREHYYYINSVLPCAKDMICRLKRLIEGMEEMYGFAGLGSSEIGRLDHGIWYLSMLQMLKEKTAILMDKAADMDLGSYLDWAREMVERQWSYDIQLLADKITRFELDLEECLISNARVTPKGFECFLSDKNGRGLYARMIWAAENSVLVTPHSRYIVTER